MEIKGKIIKVSDIQTGVSKTKGTPWMSQTYILETQETRPRKVAFDVFGEDKIKYMNIQPGEDLTVYFDIDARESQGRWYNQLRAWKVERISVANVPTIQVPLGPATYQQPGPSTNNMDPLPFDDPNSQLDFPF